ncbi:MULTISPECIES: glutathione S-transferase family protein [Nostocales]|uniref:Glutathione S-transferase family protein n=3 Tax=Nostocales TaxID=1161 RepID=A0A0C1R4P9_9CYAN|nr:glutathione S-transferase family protein [Tolypothrix bouteillei]KAF3889218.1 glutathione S-transferase family protein [Tolypothrix bouteillei VB521301]
MLKFYYNPRSPMARRVWVTLLEKEISFEPILLNLNGDQMEPEFLGINPFHHIPVIIDNGFRVIESLAIMDYLEAKYPTPEMLPKEAQALATVRTVQMVTNNELLPQIITLMYKDASSPQFVQATEHVNKVFSFLTDILGENSYFGSDRLTFGDIVVGGTISLLVKVGISLNNYPKLNDWYERLMQREAWSKTELSQEEFEQFKRVLNIIRKRKLSQTRSQPATAVT